MDPRLEFTFQLLIDHTGLPRNSVMDYVFESNMVLYTLYYNTMSRIQRALQIPSVNCVQIKIWFSF